MLPKYLYRSQVVLVVTTSRRTPASRTAHWLAAVTRVHGRHRLKSGLPDTYLVGRPGDLLGAPGDGFSPILAGPRVSGDYLTSARSGGQ